MAENGQMWPCAVRTTQAKRPIRGIRTGLRAIGAVAALCVVAGHAAAGDRELGEYLSSECVTCHQLSGRFDGIPSIVGRAEPELISALSEYRDKVRDNQVMRAIAAKFNDEEIAALASYFGSLEQEQSERSTARAENARELTPSMEGTK